MIYYISNIIFGQDSQFFAATVMKMLTLKKARLPHWQITNTHDNIWTSEPRRPLPSKRPPQKASNMDSGEMCVGINCNITLLGKAHFFMKIQFSPRTKNLAKIKVNNIRYSNCFLSFQAKNMTLRSEWPAVSPCKAELNFPRLFSPITFKCTGGSRGSVWNMYGLSVFNVLKEERHQTMLLLQGSAPRCKRFEL